MAQQRISKEPPRARDVPIHSTIVCIHVLLNKGGMIITEAHYVGHGHVEFVRALKSLSHNQRRKEKNFFFQTLLIILHENL